MYWYQIGTFLLNILKGELRINDMLSSGWLIYNSLTGLFKQHEVSEKDLFNRIQEFFSSTNIREITFNKIRAYMFAGLARKCYGQKKFLTRSMWNDIKAISTYMPYCDAMFVDKECAHILSQKSLCNNLNYKTKIFSLRNINDFISYLYSLINNSPKKVIDRAEAIDGEFRYRMLYYKSS
jgi:hypothetical protein